MSQAETHFISRQLFRSIAHSFEQLVFFETDKSELENALISDNVTGFVIDITQPYSGRMVILGDKDLFSAVTEQFFGTTSPPGTSDPLHDIGCELANTIAGHFMAELFRLKHFALACRLDSLTTRYLRTWTLPPAA